MVRNFITHKIRKTIELSEKFWDFTPLQGSEAGKTRKLWVPGCWENEPGLESYRGIGIYETSFKASGTVKIEFKGVSHFARVFIDDELVAEHYGSYTAFSVYKQNLPAGTHSLKVEVDNQFDEKYALDIPNDYYSYGGISRGVVLEFLPDVSLEWVHVTPLSHAGNDWKVKVDVACKSLASSGVHRDLEIFLAGTRLFQKEVQILPGETVVWSGEAELTGADAWSPEHPALYEAEIRLWNEGKTEDDLIDRFGLRTVQVEGNQILLNGKKLRIKGFCRHEEHPQYGCALPAAAMQQDLEQVCSWNMYPYWYDDDTATEKLERLYAWLQEPGRGAGKPLLVTEIGAGAVYGFRSRAGEVWSEELQKEILEKQLREAAAFPDCIGMYIWQFCDVRVSKEWAMRRPKSRNNKGIVDEYRRPKLAYEAVKEVFRSLPDYR